MTIPVRRTLSQLTLWEQGKACAYGLDQVRMMAATYIGEIIGQSGITAVTVRILPGQTERLLIGFAIKHLVFCEIRINVLKSVYSDLISISLD